MAAGHRWPPPHPVITSTPNWANSASCQLPRPLPKTTPLDLLATPSPSRGDILGPHNAPHGFLLFPLYLIFLVPFVFSFFLAAFSALISCLPQSVPIASPTPRPTSFSSFPASLLCVTCSGAEKQKKRSPCFQNR